MNKQGYNLLYIKLSFVLFISLLFVNISYAKVIESEEGMFQVAIPQEVGFTKTYKVQIKVDSKSIKKNANFINTYKCQIMNSKFDDNELFEKIPPIGQRAYTQYNGEEIINLELANNPFRTDLSKDYNIDKFDCKIEFIQCDEDCNSPSWAETLDVIEFSIPRATPHELKITSPIQPTINENVNPNEGGFYAQGQKDGIYHDYNIRIETYPYKHEKYTEKYFNIGDENEVIDYAKAQLEETKGYYSGDWNEIKTFEVPGSLFAYYNLDKTPYSSPSEYESKEAKIDVESNIYANIYYQHFMVVISFDQRKTQVLKTQAQEVKDNMNKELIDLLNTYSLIDGQTVYGDDLFEEIEEGKIEFEEEEKVPQYPLYDSFFDYDGDGMLNDDEYADYLAIEESKIEMFNEFYSDDEKIEYKEDTPTDIVVNNDEKITSFDLKDIFLATNKHEGAILHKSDIIVSEVKGVKSDIDKISKRIQNMENSLEELSKDIDSNVEEIKKIQKKIIASKQEIKDKSKIQTDMIKSIDKEYSILLKKIDNDIAKANDDDVRIVLEDKRKALLDNARYAKVNAYFHSGNDAEFEKIVKSNKYKVDSSITSKIELLVGLKKLEKGMPQSALHDFKSAMLSDPNNPVARELTTKIETAYLDGIEKKLLLDLQKDSKAYNKSNQAGKEGASEVVSTILTTGIASSTGALFGYEEAKALESDILQTEVSKQIAGVKITKALMKSGMTLKEIKELTKPEEFQELAKKFGKDISIEQAKKYREMVYQAHENQDVKTISSNSYMPLILDSRKSYYSNNYDAGLVHSALDFINVKNVITTLGPSASVKYGKEIMSVKDVVRKASGIDKFQKALMTSEYVVDGSPGISKLMTVTASRLGKDFKTISQYGDARKMLIGFGAGIVEGEVVGKGSEFALGKEKGKIFSELYGGIMGFTGLNDIGDISDVASKINDDEFVDLTQSLGKGILDKGDLIEGQIVMAEKLKNANMLAQISDSNEANEKLLQSLKSKDAIDDDVLDKYYMSITQAENKIPEVDSDILLLKETQLSSTKNALQAYKDGDYESALKYANKAKHMDELIEEGIEEITTNKKMADATLNMYDKVNAKPELKMELKDIIAENPIKVGDSTIPKIDLDPKSGRVTVSEMYETLKVSIKDDGTPASGFKNLLINENKVSKALGYQGGLNEEAGKFGLKVTELIIKQHVPENTFVMVDTKTKEYAFVLDIDNNNVVVKVKPEESKDGENIAEVTKTFVMSDGNINKNLKSKRYVMVKEVAKNE